MKGEGGGGVQHRLHFKSLVRKSNKRGKDDPFLPASIKKISIQMCYRTLVVLDDDSWGTTLNPGSKEEFKLDPVTWYLISKNIYL